MISVFFRIPAVERLSMARFVIVMLYARIASGIPGTRLSIISSVASGVISLGEKPVPPVVRISSAVPLSAISAILSDNIFLSSGRTSSDTTSYPFFSTISRIAVGLAVKYKSFPDELSGGEQQRVALARALVNRPDILLADEPTGNLDPKTSEEIMKLLEQINDRGTTVVVVTHNKDIVNSMRKRVVTMHEGSIISDEKEGEYHEA